MFHAPSCNDSTPGTGRHSLSGPHLSIPLLFRLPDLHLGLCLAVLHRVEWTLSFALGRQFCWHSEPRRALSRQSNQCEGSASACGECSFNARRCLTASSIVIATAAGVFGHSSSSTVSLDGFSSATFGAGPARVLTIAYPSTGARTIALTHSHTYSVHARCAFLEGNMAFPEG